MSNKEARIAIETQKPKEAIKAPELVGEAGKGMAKNNWREGKYIGKS